MLWLIAIATTLGLISIGKRLGAIDEVHAVALYVAAFVSGLWGIAIAPIEAQLVLALMTLGGAGTLGMQSNSLRS